MRDNAIRLAARSSWVLLRGGDGCGDSDGAEGIHWRVCVVADATGEFTAASMPFLYIFSIVHRSKLVCNLGWSNLRWSIKLNTIEYTETTASGRWAEVYSMIRHPLLAQSSAE